VTSDTPAHKQASGLPDKLVWLKTNVIGPHVDKPAPKMPAAKMPGKTPEWTAPKAWLDRCTGKDS